jgi:energy-coupling factor transporter transmembrane protein EcfT
MHPITIIEFLFAIGLFILSIFVSFVVVKKTEKNLFKFVGLLFIVEVLFFVVRPFWINYRISIKTDQLNAYLSEKYPNEKWKISSNGSREYNPYHLKVTFQNEEDWTYSYFVKDENTITQNGYTVPDGQSKKQGKHFE